MRQIGLCLAVLVVAAGCAKKNETVTVTARPSSPYADGKAHIEPVFYNGKHYDVGLTYVPASAHYDVKVSGRGGRKLAGSAGDQKIVQDLASSTVRHFACAGSQKAQIVPGSARHTGSAWAMQARCV